MVLHTKVASPPVMKLASVLLNEKRPNTNVCPAEISGAEQVVLLYAPAEPVVQVNNLLLVVKLAPAALAGNTAGHSNGKAPAPIHWNEYVPLVTGLGSIAAGTVIRITVLLNRRSARLLFVTVMSICTSLGVTVQLAVDMVIWLEPV